MAGLGSFLLALSGPIARQVLVALGIGVISYVGIDAAVGGLLAQAKSSWSAMPAGVAEYVALSGANTGLSIIAGGILGRVSLIPLKRLRLL